MGDHNSKKLLKKLVPKVNGTVLEIGSLDNGDGKSTQLRDFYTNGPYYGIDIQAGNNVDIVCDLCYPYIFLLEDFYGYDVSDVQLIYSISVFEHLSRPWTAADNLKYILQKDGLLFISVPWVWRWHGYPDDYFRYSFSGIKILFPEFEWLYEGTCSINGIHKQYKIDQKNDDNNEIVKMKGQKYLPYTTINMLGRKL